MQGEQLRRLFERLEHSVHQSGWQAVPPDLFERGPSSAFPEPLGDAPDPYRIANHILSTLRSQSTPLLGDAQVRAMCEAQGATDVSRLEVLRDRATRGLGARRRSALRAVLRGCLAACMAMEGPTDAHLAAVARVLADGVLARPADREQLAAVSASLATMAQFWDFVLDEGDDAADVPSAAVAAAASRSPRRAEALSPRVAGAVVGAARRAAASVRALRDEYARWSSETSQELAQAARSAVAAVRAKEEEAHALRTMAAEQAEAAKQYRAAAAESQSLAERRAEAAAQVSAQLEKLREQHDDAQHAARSLELDLRDAQRRLADSERERAVISAQLAPLLDDQRSRAASAAESARRESALEARACQAESALLEAQRQAAAAEDAASQLREERAKVLADAAMSQSRESAAQQRALVLERELSEARHDLRDALARAAAHEADAEQLLRERSSLAHERDVLAAELGGERHTIASALAAAHAEATTASGRLAATQAELEAERAKYLDASRALKRAKESETRAAAERDKLSDEAAELSARSQTLSAQLAASRAESEELRKQVARLLSAEDEKPAESAGSIQAANAWAELRGAENEAELRARAEEAEYQLAQERAYGRKLQAEANTLRGQLAVAEERVAEQQRAIEHEAEELRQRSAELEAARMEVAALRPLAAGVAERKESLERSLPRCSADFASVVRGSSTPPTPTLSGSVRSKLLRSVRRSAVEDDTKKLTEENARLNKELAAARDEARRVREALEQEVSELVHERSGLLDELNVSEDDVRGLRGELRALEQRAASIRMSATAHARKQHRGASESGSDSAKGGGCVLSHVELSPMDKMTPRSAGRIAAEEGTQRRRQEVNQMIKAVHARRRLSTLHS
eukprot:m51a1_g6930 hypothetical protein (873) ;mRNA; f:183450-186612